MEVTTKKCTNCGSTLPLWFFNYTEKGIFYQGDTCSTRCRREENKREAEEYALAGKKRREAARVAEAVAAEKAKLAGNTNRREMREAAIRAGYSGGLGERCFMRHRASLITACTLRLKYRKEISAVYTLAAELSNLSGVRFHVDHVCPIAARIYDPDFNAHLPATGLHVPWNLDPIPAGRNISKSNRVTLAEVLAPTTLHFAK